MLKDNSFDSKTGTSEKDLEKLEVLNRWNKLKNQKLSSKKFSKIMSETNSTNKNLFLIHENVNKIYCKNKLELSKVTKELEVIQKDSLALKAYFKHKDEQGFIPNEIISVALLQDISEIDKKDIFIRLGRVNDIIKVTKCNLYQLVSRYLYIIINLE